MGRRSVQWLVVPVMLTALAVSACAAGKPAAGPEQGGGPSVRMEPKVQGSLVYSTSDSPVNFNPILFTDQASSWVIERVFSSLIQINEKLEPVPDLAVSWTASADGRQWTITLRKDVKFHDGQPLTADDVAYTYNAFKDKGYTGVRAAQFKWLDRVEAVDPSTVRFVLNQPYAPILTYLTYGILPKHLYDAQPVAEMKNNPANRKPVGSGPWKFGEWVSGQYVSLVRNDAYYGQGPYIPDVRLKFVPDSNVALAQLEAGELDVVQLPAREVKRIMSTYADRFNFYKYEGMAFTYLCFNLTKPGLGDKAVRQAMAFALDRQKMISDILEGEGILEDAPMPPASWAYTSKGVTSYSYNPAKSVDILEKAGYRKGNDGIYAKDGTRLSYTLIVQTGNPVYESLALVIQKELKDIGIEVKPEFIESSVMLTKYVYLGNFEIFLNALSVGVDPDPYSFFHSSQAQKNAQGQFVGFNRAQYSNPEMDRLLDSGRLESDQAKRKEIYARYQQIISDEIPWLVLYSPKVTFAVNKKVQGVIAGPMGPIRSWLWYE